MCLDQIMDLSHYHYLIIFIISLLSSHPSSTFSSWISFVRRMKYLQNSYDSYTSVHHRHNIIFYFLIILPMWPHDEQIWWVEIDKFDYIFCNCNKDSLLSWYWFPSTNDPLSFSLSFFNSISMELSINPTLSTYQQIIMWREKKLQNKFQYFSSLLIQQILSLFIFSHPYNYYLPDLLTSSHFRPFVLHLKIVEFWLAHIH